MSQLVPRMKSLAIHAVGDQANPRVRDPMQFAKVPGYRARQRDEQGALATVLSPHQLVILSIARQVPLGPAFPRSLPPRLEQKILLERRAPRAAVRLKDVARVSTTHVMDDVESKPIDRFLNLLGESKPRQSRTQRMADYLAGEISAGNLAIEQVDFVTPTRKPIDELPRPLLGAASPGPQPLDDDSNPHEVSPFFRRRRIPRGSREVKTDIRCGAAARRSRVEFRPRPIAQSARVSPPRRRRAPGE